MTTETQHPAPKKVGKGRKFLIFITLLVVLILFGGVVGMQQFIASKKAEAAANMPETVSTVTAMTVAPSDWSPVITAVGYVRPSQGAMLSSESSGKISRILVQAGQRVNKGDLLVEFDNTVEFATLKTYEAQLPAAKASYERYRKLVASNSASQADLDSAKATYDQLLANLETQKSTIKRRQIYAPFSGVAGIVNVNEGQYISSGTNIVRVEDPSTMKFHFTLPQDDIAKISVGQKVEGTIDALGGKTVTAHVIAIDPAVDSTSGLVVVEAAIDNGQANLLSGMFARLNVELPVQANQIVLPQIAITYSMYGETLYVLQPLSDEDKALVEKMKAKNASLDVNKMYRAKQVEVTSADKRGILAQVSKGVKAGDLVVTGGFQHLSNNGLVILSDAEPVGVTKPESVGNL